MTTTPRQGAAAAGRGWAERVPATRRPTAGAAKPRSLGPSRGCVARAGRKTVDLSVANRPPPRHRDLIPASEPTAGRVEPITRRGLPVREPLLTDRLVLRDVTEADAG